jgi:alpha-mannosidase
MPKTYNPLPQLIPARIAHLRQVLGGSLWSNRQDLSVSGGPINNYPVPVAEAPAQPMAPVRPGEYFGAPSGDWQQRWFCVEVPAPQPAEAGRRYFFWDCRGETTAYLDGDPWAGLDGSHPYCILPDRACTLWLDCGTYQTAMWGPGKNPDQYGLRFEGAWTACRNALAWETYWDLDVLCSLMEHLLKEDGLSDTLRMWGPYPEIVKTHPVLRKLLYRLDEAYKAWEIGGTDHRGGVDALAPALKQIYREFPAEVWQPHVTLVGHSHLDLVWMWPEVEGERKGVHTFATALRLLEEYPEFTFMWTSPSNYQALERRAPSLHAAIREQIRTGRWEATGGAWLEFDTLIACGEALGRSLALGQRYFEKLRGAISTTMWVPDCFGYNAALPQLLQLAGVRNFFTTKMSWSGITNFPYHSFVWRSPDGAEVLTHLAVIGDPESPGGLAHMARTYRQGDVHGEMLTGLGVGDGGGGTTVASIERVRRMADLSLTPRAGWGYVEPFFERLEQQREQLPVFEGELYLEFHRGIYTTHSEFKRKYRQLERALQAWEAVRVVTGGAPIPEHPWERLCFCQFHDAIPGSSIQLVYDQLEPELQSLSEQALQQAAADLSASVQPDGSCAGLAVFNPLLLPRRAVIELPAGARVTLDDGQDLLIQPVPDGLLASVPLDGFGLRCLSVSDTSAADPGVNVLPAWEVSPQALDNGLLRVEFDAQGHITLARDAISAWPLAEPPAFILYPDNPPYFDAWEVDHGAMRQGGVSLSGMSLEAIERGPVRGILRGTTPLGEHSRLTVDYILEAGSDVLRIEALVDWREEHRLLKYHLPTLHRGRLARFAAPFGSVARPQVPGFPHEEAMWEVPASRWAAVTDDAGYDGLAIVTEAKYGFSCRDGNLGLSLLRAADDPVRGDPTQPQRLCPDHATDQGMHRIRFALAHYRAASLEGHLSTAAQAEALYAPLVISTVSGKAAWTPPVSVPLDLGTLVPSWALPSRQGGGYILRLHETLGVPGTLQLAFARVPQGVQPVDLLERPVEGVVVDKLDELHYEVKVAPYQVVSLRVM